jgi:hypothetical protein
VLAEGPVARPGSEPKDTGGWLIWDLSLSLNETQALLPG